MLQKHKLDQIAARNIRNIRISFEHRPFVRIWTQRRLPSLVFAKNTTVLQSKNEFVV